MDQKQEPSLSLGEEVDIKKESYERVEHQPEIIREDINETEKETPVKKKKSWIKRIIEKIDNYLYDLEIIFSTSSDIKLERKARNVYILKSSLIFSFCLIFSYASSSGYFYIVNHIEKTQEERSQRLQENGVPIIFSNEEIKSQN